MPSTYPSRVGAALAVGAAMILAACGGEAPVPPTAPPAGDDAATPRGGGARLETVATGLEVPWEIAFLPDGRALVTERPGRLRMLSREGELRPDPVAELDVSAVGEGGLMGVAVDPDFERNPFVYLYRTTDTEGNTITRHRLEGERLTGEQTIVDGIEAATFHDGGRLRFGPDDRLYLATGDALEPELAQDRGSLNGKFLRLEPEAYRRAGGRPEMVSLGHRNPQGFAWRPGDDALVATEHGPDGDDEVNVIRGGRNYGWPDARGRRHGAFEAPVAVYPQSVAPAGATFVSRRGSAWTGDLLFGTLVGEQVRRVRLDGDRVVADEALFEGELGRVRSVVEGPGGALYALTSNRDGRGTPREGDDRVVRIVPPAE